MVLHIDIKDHAYDVVIEKGVLDRASEELNLNRKVLIVTDSGVPAYYSEIILKQCKEGYIYTIEEGEDNKSLENFSNIQKVLLMHHFTRKDCVVAVGGGVVGDLSGFAASCYMRGIDFYNIPTTVLSQVDSSIGGKTAVNFNGVKNIVGTFYQPKKVLIDINTHKTLSQRLISEGLTEAIKMAATFDKELFSMFEAGVDVSDLTEVIYKAVDIKRRVVEQDEKEMGLRKVLNFGHTLGHGIELTSDGKFLHGESVALGMLMMCEPKVKERLLSIYEKLDLPVSCDVELDKAIDAVSHDKKSNGSAISSIYVKEIGSYEIVDMTIDELKERMNQFLKG